MTIVNHRYQLLLTVRSSPGVLVRCAQMFNRRGHNIEAITVSPIADTDNAQMTITAAGDAVVTNQIVLQLKKIIDVIDVTQKDL